MLGQARFVRTAMDEEELLRCLGVVIEGTAVRGHLEALQRAAAQDPTSAAVSALGPDVAEMAEERLELLRRSAHFCPRHAVNATGRQEEALLTLTELWRFYLPLCQLLLATASGARERTLIGIAGPPGSGKSVFAALLADLMTVCGRQRHGEPLVCPMDGFHYPNSYLETRFATDGGGNRVSLLWKKGAPETFDVAAFIECLDRLRAEPTVSVPAYDRRMHDVVPDGITVTARHTIVLLEGNYLLLNRGGWKRVAPRLDMTIFLMLPLGAARNFIIRRHVRGGRTYAEAVRHFEEVDRKNYDVCAASAAGADLIVERTARHRISAIRSGRPATGGNKTPVNP